MDKGDYVICVVKNTNTNIQTQKYKYTSANPHHGQRQLCCRGSSTSTPNRRSLHRESPSLKMLFLMIFSIIRLNFSLMIFSITRSNFIKVVPSPENFVARTSAHLPSKIIDMMITTAKKIMMRMMLRMMRLMLRMMMGMMRMMMGMMMRMIRMTATFPERSHTSLQTQIFAWSDLKVGFLIILLTIMTIISRQPQ